MTASATSRMAGLLAAVRAVAFDVTGTLLELAEPVGATYARAAAERGVRLDPSRADRAFAAALAAAPPLAFADRPPAERARAERAWWRDVVACVVRESAVGVTGVAALPAGLFEDLYERFASAGAWRRRPGAAETLEVLAARGYPLAVLSNFDGRLPGLLRATGLGRHLEVVVTSSEAGAAKPDARAFAAVVERLGLPAVEVAYVGDSADTDGRGAWAAGLVPVLLGADPREGSIAVRIERLGDLLAFLPGPSPRRS